MEIDLQVTNMYEGVETIFFKILSGMQPHSQGLSGNEVVRHADWQGCS